jgi:hypothetical protein
MGHVSQADGHAFGVDAERDAGKILNGFEVAANAHHVLGMAHFHHASARFAVAGAHRFLDSLQAQAIACQPVGVDLDLELPHHAADAGHFGHARHALQFVLEEKILHCTQLLQVIFVVAIHQRIFEHPADTGRIGA